MSRGHRAKSSRKGRMPRELRVEHPGQRNRPEKQRRETERNKRETGTERETERNRDRLKKRLWFGQVKAGGFVLGWSVLVTVVVAKVVGWARATVSGERDRDRLKKVENN